MDLLHHIQQLSRNATIFRTLMSGVSEEQARWKPAPDRWSLLEVINHLGDEECEDFRTRLELVLHNPEQPWPPINPFQWVTSRSYNKRDVEQSLNRLLHEREKSLNWLKGLSSPKWDTVHSGPGPGNMQMHAGDVMVSWVAHDYFHIRQMTNLNWEYLNITSQPYSTEYAGPFA